MASRRKRIAASFGTDLGVERKVARQFCVELVIERARRPAIAAVLAAHTAFVEARLLRRDVGARGFGDAAGLVGDEEPARPALLYRDAHDGALAGEVERAIAALGEVRIAVLGLKVEE